MGVVTGTDTVTRCFDARRGGTASASPAPAAGRPLSKRTVPHSNGPHRETAGRGRDGGTATSAGTDRRRRMELDQINVAVPRG